MLSALLYLRFTSLKNLLRMRLLRLKQPKYLVGAIVGGAYVWFFFLRRTFMPPTTGGGNSQRALRSATQAMQHAGVAAPDNLLGIGLAVGAVALLVFVTLLWVFSVERASLGFTEAEIAFLFPAPATRNMLVQFRLVDAQLRSLLGALVMTLFSNRWMFAGGSPVAHAFGWWLIFTAFNLHLAGVRFTLTRLADRGLSTLWRRLLVLGAVVAIIATTLALLPPEQRLADFTADSAPRAIGRWIINVTSGAPLAWVLWPAKLLLGPFFADSVRAFFTALGPALLVIAVHYVWVVRSVVSFEEGSIARAEKRGAIIAAMRSGKRLGRGPTKGRRPSFKLASTGRPEVAFLWKNLLGTWAWLNPRTWAWCAAAIVAVAVWVNTHPELRWWLYAYGPVALIIGGYTLVAGPQFARQDIRSDLANADLLKTYPLPGWQIVLGEMLAPTAILSGILWLVLLAAAVSFFPRPQHFTSFSPAVGEFVNACLAPAARVPLALCLAVLVPPIIALQLFVPNAAALVFPGWFQATRQRVGGGIDIMGQRMIFFFAQLLTMVIAVLPALIAGAAAVAVACFVFGLPAIVGVWVAATGILAVLLAELWLGLKFLGARFEKFDLSSELRP